MNEQEKLLGVKNGLFELLVLAPSKTISTYFRVTKKKKKRKKKEKDKKIKTENRKKEK